MTCVFTGVLFAIGCSQQIPPGVRYVKANPAVNRKFAALLRDLMTTRMPESKQLDCLAKVVVCGPSLWPLVQRVQGKNAGDLNVTFMVPIKGREPQVLQGRAFRERKSKIELVKTLQALISLAPARLRPLEASEIQYYWAIISYDIDEPIYALESKKITLFFHAQGARSSLSTSPADPPAGRRGCRIACSSLG